ncbi:hypothetical protein CPB84DRAFT_1778404 [Gymnopilus junonius]|uniref:Uncharacterized protein n=1 Tax=Gymnopilus junonius TaxID=109634 RepID=A0A9P5NR19_GYMJU|nr:hypothetical protein CPB84DRAFT_1778404 [Gymnopilus junonius]
MAPMTCSCKHDGRDHYFIRCGCKNDYPDEHPMHINDDAFHHVWCNLCLRYCFKKPLCPAKLPSTQAVRFGKQLAQDKPTGFFTTFRVWLHNHLARFPRRQKS